MNDLDQLSYTLAQAAKATGEHYVTWWRRVCRNEVKVLEGQGRLRIPRSEISKFLAQTTTYQPRKKSRLKKSAQAAAK